MHQCQTYNTSVNRYLKVATIVKTKHIKQIIDPSTTHIAAAFVLIHLIPHTDVNVTDDVIVELLPALVATLLGDYGDLNFLKQIWKLAATCEDSM